MPDPPAAKADEMHLDPVPLAVEERPVRETRQVEIGPELAVDPGEEVEIEPRSDAGRVVVGGLEVIAQ